VNIPFSFFVLVEGGRGDEGLNSLIYSTRNTEYVVCVKQINWVCSFLLYLFIDYLPSVHAVFLSPFLGNGGI
jgi:hypothetical protein